MTKRGRILFYGACLAAAIAAGSLFSTIEKVFGQVTAVGPFATVTSVSSSVVQIGAANASRRSFEICNGAAGALVYVLPALGPTGAAVNPTTTSGIPIANNACFIVPGNLLASGSGVGGGQAWNAISSGAATVVAFVEW